MILTTTTFLGLTISEIIGVLGFLVVIFSIAGRSILWIRKKFNDNEREFIKLKTEFDLKITDMNMRITKSENDILVLSDKLDSNKNDIIEKLEALKDNNNQNKIDIINSLNEMKVHCASVCQEK